MTESQNNTINELKKEIDSLKIKLIEVEQERNLIKAQFDELKVILRET
tara:strand:- start:727 stop:870 length:144 start_codon:yes stop_codon:yes gene_type:complete